MEKLTQIIKDEFSIAGQAVKEIAIGSAYGAVTPIFMDTCLRQLFDGAESIIRSTAQVVSTLAIHVPLAKFAIEHGRGLEYFGLLAGTNALNYLVNAYRRSRK